MGQPVIHFEIGCMDIAKTRHFFSELFGWQAEIAGPAAMIDTKSYAGIAGHITALGHEPHNYTILYVQVDDVKASLDRVEKPGGKILVPPVDIPTNTFSWFADPEGNTIGLWKPKN
jgi:uncharacterized protein